MGKQTTDRRTFAIMMPVNVGISGGQLHAAERRALVHGIVPANRRERRIVERGRKRSGRR